MVSTVNKSILGTPDCSRHLLDKKGVFLWENGAKVNNDHDQHHIQHLLKIQQNLRIAMGKIDLPI
jgi:hypothetical protein